MYVNIRHVVLLVLAAQQVLGFHIRSTKVSPPEVDGPIDGRDDWKMFQNRLRLSREKVKLLKSQKDQQGTKELLRRFIIDNPKYLSTSTGHKKKRPTNQFNRLFRAMVDNLKSSKKMLKTSFNFVLTERPSQPLKRSRRKIAVKMVSDMSSERVDDFLKMFYEKHNVQKSPYANGDVDQHNVDGDYNDGDIPRSTSMGTDVDSDYAYDNLYDDESDVGLNAKSQQNAEYGSFQDLILQAKRKQWEQESEETKLYSPENDHFI